MSTPVSTCHPLEATPVHRSLSITVDGRTVTADARAHWGGVEVTLTSPVTGLTRGWDGRGWAFAMLAAHRPDERYALRGELTAKGRKAAEAMAAALYQDWLAVRRHEADVDAACCRARRELAELDRAAVGRKEPLREERVGLRRAFKAGALAEADYQGRRKELSEVEQRIDRDRHLAGEAVALRFAAWMEGHVGRKMSLAEAERLLCEGAVVVGA
jgi:hypothetical protein